MLQDVNTGIAWVLRHAPAFGGDGKSFHLVGQSVSAEPDALPASQLCSVVWAAVRAAVATLHMPLCAELLAPGLFALHAGGRAAGRPGAHAPNAAGADAAAAAGGVASLGPLAHPRLCGRQVGRVGRWMGACVGFEAGRCSGGEMHLLCFPLAPPGSSWRAGGWVRARAVPLTIPPLPVHAPSRSGAYNLYALADHLHRRGLYRNLFEVRWLVGGAGCTSAVCCSTLPAGGRLHLQAVNGWLAPAGHVFPNPQPPPAPAGHSLSRGQAHAARAVPNLPHPVRRPGGACAQPGCGCMLAAEPRCTLHAACLLSASLLTVSSVASLRLLERLAYARHLAMPLSRAGLTALPRLPPLTRPAAASWARLWASACRPCSSCMAPPTSRCPWKSRSSLWRRSRQVEADARGELLAGGVGWQLAEQSPLRFVAAFRASVQWLARAPLAATGGLELVAPGPMGAAFQFSRAAFSVRQVDAPPPMALLQAWIL